MSETGQRLIAAADEAAAIARGERAACNTYHGREAPPVNEIERRVLTACRTIRALPDGDRKHLYGSLRHGCWNEAVNEWDAYASEDVAVRFVPSPADVSDCLVALDWMLCLNRQEWKLVWWRSYPNVSFAIMAGRIGRSDETARTRYYQAIDKIDRYVNRSTGITRK